ncbi:uncharacterized protein LOC107425010 [Ziziphus jujuba]|uniref:Uncharacterized protein LOC107425010 n=1 Tax=Ziziphus jujuba TaxID=326968 RepID=A0A6P4A7X0_ZIZJJ|nr:uncharacterized protein LOC107425010 [Ziziphus jujuba]
MATTTTITASNNIINKPPKPITTTKLACFSFAAYAKTLIDHLKSSGIHVLDGLADVEFSSIESTFNFSFPPDLRSILREGLPVGPGFPNWRSSSLQQLHILTNLPILGLLKQVTERTFWCRSWGIRPDDDNLALDVAKRFLNRAPILVPIYRNCYIPSSPNMAGNPILFVDAKNVSVLSCDIAGFFQEFEFLHGGGVCSGSSKRLTVNLPAWAAKVARTIEFWTEAAERSSREVPERGNTRGRWWSSGELDGCLEEVFWVLREGGWTEEEVREMMMMDDCDEPEGRGESRTTTAAVIGDKESMVWHVRLMSLVLLRAGWTREDVVYSLDLHDDGDEIDVLDGKSCLELPRPDRYFKINDHKKTIMKQLKHPKSLAV